MLTTILIGKCTYYNKKGKSNYGKTRRN
uniref:Uncharacterized protein n=1 Tax=Rhizophora mucronata TaxID=61149 RepID=A0A2P2IID9_RHIMU